MQARNGTNAISGVAGSLPILGEMIMMLTMKMLLKIIKNLKMLLKKIMKAEPMFFSSMEPVQEISGGRVAKPHAFPW